MWVSQRSIRRSRGWNKKSAVGETWGQQNVVRIQREDAKRKEFKLAFLLCAQTWSNCLWCIMAHIITHGRIESQQLSQNPTPGWQHHLHLKCHDCFAYQITRNSIISDLLSFDVIKKKENRDLAGIATAPKSCNRHCVGVRECSHVSLKVFERLDMLHSARKEYCDPLGN